MDDAARAETPAVDGRRRQRHRRRRLALVLVPLAAVIGVAVAWYGSGRYVTAENAYIKADIIGISADVSGRVIRIDVDDNDAVGSGQFLFALDPAPFEIALAAARAQVQLVRGMTESRRAEYRQISAEIVEAERSVAYHQTRYDRQQQLRERAISTLERLEEARHDLDVATQRVLALRQNALRVLARLGGDIDLPVEALPAWLEAGARRDRAALDLSHTMIFAPADGILSNVRLEVGEFVVAGTTALSLIAAGDPWVEANMKETETTNIEVGQPATVTVDAWPDLVWTASVQSISPATGSEFALLPPQNATGNWVKVVQRIPVRFTIDPGQHPRPLRAGMTVTVTIDTGAERGPFAWLWRLIDE